MHELVVNVKFCSSDSENVALMDFMFSSFGTFERYNGGGGALVNGLSF